MGDVVRKWEKLFLKRIETEKYRTVERCEEKKKSRKREEEKNYFSVYFTEAFQNNNEKNKLSLPNREKKVERILTSFQGIYRLSLLFFLLNSNDN